VWAPIADSSGGAEEPDWRLSITRSVRGRVRPELAIQSRLTGYDANGNMTTRNGSTISYTSYNLPTSIPSGANSSTLAYGAWRNTVKQVAVTSGTTETTIYVAGLLEKVTKGTTTEYRHRIDATPGTVAIYVRKSSGSNATYYLHRDHLGSPEMITNASGNSVVKLSFSAYGERRDADWDGPITSSHLTSATNVTRHGYTDHLHLDSVKLVHMGGRVYDPVIGRFLSRDPYIDGVDSSQGANGYAYVWNNPLTRWDPTGFNSTIPGRDYRSWANRGQWECPPSSDVCVTAQRPSEPAPAPNHDPFASLDPHWLQGLPNDSTEQLLYGYDIAWGAAAAAIAAAPGSEGLTTAASALSTSKSLDPVTTGRLLPLASIADRLEVSRLIKGAGALGSLASMAYGFTQGRESALYAVTDVGAGALAVFALGPVLGGSFVVVYAIGGGSETIVGWFD